MPSKGQPGYVAPQDRPFADQRAFVLPDDLRAQLRPDTNTPEFKNWFGESKVTAEDGTPAVVYHGTQRPDRLGNVFRRSRATSGPMAFFTDDPSIASNYATGKSDTSFEGHATYSDWFKFKPQGARSAVPLDRAWWTLSPEQRTALTDTLPRVTDLDPAGNEMAEGLRIASAGQTGIVARDTWQYELRQAHGNALKAAVAVWLDSGKLFGNEAGFINVLRVSGFDASRVDFDHPHRADSAVYPVFLKIENPLKTAEIPAGVVDALDAAARRSRQVVDEHHADQWGKNRIAPLEWMEALRADITNGTDYAWTTIPDWVTRTLKDLGYDGVHDQGGKYTGRGHNVWVPFTETQVKSASGNRGTFDPGDKDIRHRPDTSTDGTAPLAGVEAGESGARGLVGVGASTGALVDSPADKRGAQD